MVVIYNSFCLQLCVSLKPCKDVIQLPKWTEGTNTFNPVWQHLLWITSHKAIILLFIYLFLFLFFVISRAAPTAYGGFQAWGLVRAVPEPQPGQIWAGSATYTTAHGNAGCLTHWVRPGIECATSLFLVRVVNHWAMTGVPCCLFC